MKFIDIDLSLRWFWIKIIPGPVNNMNNIGQKKPKAKQIIPSWITAEIKNVINWDADLYLWKNVENRRKSR